MTPAPEDIARRLGQRPGYRLLSYREVALPFWELPLRCRLMAKKPLGAVDEFVLRCAEAELESSSDIADFLGLPERLVEVVMARLVAAGNLAPRRSTDDGPVTFFLTDHGMRTLRELGETLPEERTLNLPFDGLVHRYGLVANSMRWRPRDIREQDLLDIPAFPADPPDVGPEDTAAVGLVVKDTAELANRELITVLGLDGKREKFFVKALALLFEATDGQDVHVSFAIDGRLSEAHDHAFAAAEGKRKLGIVDSLREGGPPVALLGPELLARRTADNETAMLSRATETFREEIGAVHRELARADGDERERLQRQLGELERRLETAESALNRAPVRLLEVHEHPRLLNEAIQQAQERLLIVSPWLRAAVVNEELGTALEECAQRGVEVSIAYGIDGGRQVQEADAAEQRLAALARGYPNFHLVRLGDTHAKVLVVDRSYVVVTSFNWLSYRGDPRRPFRDERGTLVAIPEEIDRIYDDYLRRMRVREVIDT